MGYKYLLRFKQLVKVDEIFEGSEFGKDQRKVVFDCFRIVLGGLWLDFIDLRGLEVRKL